MALFFGRNFEGSFSRVVGLCFLFYSFFICRTKDIDFWKEFYIRPERTLGIRRILRRRSISLRLGQKTLLV